MSLDVGAWSLDPASRYDLPSLAELIDRPEWMADAACREHPEIDFYPARGGDTRPAKAVCAGCLVRCECAGYAMELEQCQADAHGIWGGLSARQRVTGRRRPAA